MTTVTATVDKGDSHIAYTWASMSAGDVGNAVDFWLWPTAVAQVVDSSGAASVVIQISNDGVTWFNPSNSILSAPQLSNLDFPKARYVRPYVYTADAQATAILLLSRQLIGSDLSKDE